MATAAGALPPPLHPTPSLAQLELQRLLDALPAASQEEEGPASPSTAAPDPTPPTAAATDAPAPADQAAPPIWHPPSFSHAHELAQLRQERDAAVAQEQAALRRERNAAVAEAAEARAQLDALRWEHAALREAHAVALLRAEQAAAASAAQLASQGAQLERLQAGRAELEADKRRMSALIDSQTVKLAVLLECYQALEADWLASRAGCAPAETAGGPPASARSPARLPGPPPLGAAAAAGGAITLRAPAALAAPEDPGDAACWSLGACSEPHPAERLAVSHSHLALALRCAELQLQLGRAQRQAQQAQQAAKGAEDEVAGLRLLLARQGAGAGRAVPALQLRLEAACRQLQEAEGLGAELRRQLEAVSGLSMPRLWRRDGGGGVVPSPSVHAPTPTPPRTHPSPPPCRRRSRPCRRQHRTRCSCRATCASCWPPWTRWPRFRPACSGLRQPRPGRCLRSAARAPGAAGTCSVASVIWRRVKGGKRDGSSNTNTQYEGHGCC